MVDAPSLKAVLAKHAAFLRRELDAVGGDVMLLDDALFDEWLDSLSDAELQLYAEHRRAGSQIH